MYVVCGGVRVVVSVGGDGGGCVLSVLSVVILCIRVYGVYVDDLGVFCISQHLYVVCEGVMLAVRL